MVKAVADVVDVHAATPAYQDLAEQDEVDSVLHSQARGDRRAAPTAPEPDYDQAALTRRCRARRSPWWRPTSSARTSTSPTSRRRCASEYEATFRDQNADLLGKVPPP